MQQRYHRLPSLRHGDMLDHDRLLPTIPEPLQGQQAALEGLYHPRRGSSHPRRLDALQLLPG
jgi:hypothetical protein